MTRKDVEKVLNEKIRPMLVADGGDVELIDLKDKKAYVRLTGACGCCPHAQMTLKLGVEKILKAELPELDEVVAV